MEKTWRNMEKTWRKHGENMEKTWRNMTCDLKSKMINEWHVYGMSMACLWHVYGCMFVAPRCSSRSFSWGALSMKTASVQLGNSLKTAQLWRHGFPSRIHPNYTQYLVLPVYYQCITSVWPIVFHIFPMISYHWHFISQVVGLAFANN